MSHSTGLSEHAYSILIGDAELNFRSITIPDPIVTGRQILEAANVRPTDEHIAVAWLSDGALETLREDERFDLREKGAEKVILFKAADLYRFILDGRDFVWGATTISGSVLKKLAGVEATTHDVYQEMRKSEDMLIRDEDMVDISRPGLERFFTAIAQTTEGFSSFLPRRDAAYLESRNIIFEECSESGQSGVILKGVQLPVGKFTSDVVDVLIMLPAGYPDCPPDMFYCTPWLKLLANATDPRAANVTHAFAGQDWQRWSRHNNEWRPGVDGLHTMVKRIELALAEAG
ncbi:multiubiquitin domain-containing protein [Enterobacter asburiae]|nr:multiubiquitin domain-containing protein [Enterobacter asburiae]